MSRLHLLLILGQLKSREKWQKLRSVCCLWLRTHIEKLLVCGRKLSVCLVTWSARAVASCRRIPPWKMTKAVLVIAVTVLGLDCVRTSSAAWPVIARYPRYWQVVCGTLAFLVGSMTSMLTDGWKQTHKKLKWLRVLLVPIILAVGELLTTRGWNSWNRSDQERALVFSVARDWKLNNAQDSIHQPVSRYCTSE